MNKKPASKVLSSLIAVFAIVAIFVEYAPAFDEETAPVLGSVFTVMFGSTSKNLAVIVPLVIAFCALLLGFIIMGVSLLMNGNALKACFLAEAILFIGAGVLFLMTPNFYSAANGANSMVSVKGLGSGTICTAVFAFLAGAISLAGLLVAKKEA
jgi:hypothetical protein